MDAPARADDPVRSWEYRDHQCHVYAADGDAPGDTGEETVWAGYVRTKLPEGAADVGDELHVPGTLTDGGGSWIGFTVSDDDRDADRTASDVEELVDQLLDLETAMDG